MQTLVTIHSWVRWLVLIALVAGAAYGYVRYRAGAAWVPYFHQVVAMVVDIQVAIGATMWLFYDGWRRDFFYSFLHPVTMLGALAVIHIALAIAGRRKDVRSWAIMSVGSAVSLVLVVLAVPWERL